MHFTVNSFLGIILLMEKKNFYTRQLLLVKFAADSTKEMWTNWVFAKIISV